MNNNPSSSDKKNNIEKKDTPSSHEDPIDAIPSNEYGINGDDSIISSLDIDSVPVDSELVSTSSSDDEGLMNSQYLELPSEFVCSDEKLEQKENVNPDKKIIPSDKKSKLKKENLTSEHKKKEVEHEEQDDLIEDTIICSTEIEEEDSVLELDTIKEGLLNSSQDNDTDDQSGLLDEVEDPTLAPLSSKDQKESIMMADPLESSLLLAESIESEASLEAIPQDDVQYEVLENDMDSQCIAEAVGEETFLKATKETGEVTEAISEEEISKIQRAMFSSATYSTKDISGYAIPKLGEETDETRDISDFYDGTSSQNLPTQDLTTRDFIDTQDAIKNKMPKLSPFKKGDIIDNRYKVIDFIGQGGMAYVYKVEHQLLPGNKHFALKVLGGFMDKEQVSKRFQREVAVMMEFSHPHVIQIRDFGLTNKQSPYFTMDFCGGNTVKNFIENNGVFEIKKALKITLQILQALEEAHKKNIIHRDLKPENIMFEMREEGLHSYVLDFGIAKDLTAEYTEKLTQGVIGTLLYMSPEQATAQSLTVATDIYSLGATLYHMLTGRAPFVGKQQEILIKIVQENPLPPSYIRKGIPPQIDQLILKSLSKKTDERFASAEEFRNAIEVALEEDIFENIDKASSTLSRQAFTSGDVVNNRYRIVDVLGSGGMGIVYKVEHLELSSSKRFFALKLLDPTLSDDDSFKERFVREIEMAMEFTHENVIQIRDFGHTKKGHYYYTMDYSQGQTLSNLITKNEKLSVERSLDIIRQVLTALKTPHSKNIAHRDLKPDNILIEQRNGKDHPLVLDFGIAKIVDDSQNQQITKEGSIGTPYYMSPEQAGAENIDVRTDFYSLGIILFEMLIGKVPFTGSTKEILVAHMLKKPSKLSQYLPRIPLAIEEMTSKALEKDPAGRFRSADDFISAIDNISQREKKLIRRGKIRKLFRALVTCAMFLACAGVCFLFLYVEQKNQQIEEKFHVAVIENKKEKAQEYFQIIKKQFYGINTIVFPRKITQLSMRIDYQKAIKDNDAEKAQKLYWQIQKMPTTSALLAIQLQKQMDELHNNIFIIKQGVRKLDAFNAKEAEEIFSSFDNPNNKIKNLRTLAQEYSNLQKINNKNIDAGKQIIKKILPLLKEAQTTFPLLQFEKKIKSFSSEKSKNTSNKKNKTKFESLDKKIITQFRNATNSGKLEKAEALLIKIESKNIRPKIKNKYRAFFKKEKRFSEIKRRRFEMQEYELFLEDYPTTKHRKEIEKSILKYLQKELGKIKRKTKNHYKNNQKKLESILTNKIFVKLNNKEKRKVLQMLTRSYYFDKKYRDVNNLKENWKKVLGGSLLKNQNKYTANSRLYMGLIHLKQDPNLALKYLQFLKAHLNTIKIKDVLAEKDAYKKALQRLIEVTKNQENDQYFYMEKLAVFGDYRYCRELGNRYYKKYQESKTKSNKNSANKYYTKYLSKIQKITKGLVRKLRKSDKVIINNWLTLQNFYPLKKGNTWEYESKNFNGQERKTKNTQRIVSAKNNHYVRSEGNQKLKITIKNGMFKQIMIIKNADYEIIPKKVQLNSLWHRKIATIMNSKISVIGYNVPVKAYKNIKCLKIKFKDSISKNISYEYYAPNIGLIKVEKLENGKISFEQVLQKFYVQK